MWIFDAAEGEMNRWIIGFISAILFRWFAEKIILFLWIS